jgi:MoaA/NifB/PqqE/SkfB family radical SAM enzyme
MNAFHRSAVYPVFASFKITNKCNFRCKFCNVWKEKTQDLDTNGVKKVIDNIANSNIPLLSLEGGDPLLRADIKEILEYIKTKDIEVFITTSERDLQKYPMEEFAKYLDYLHISVDEGHRNLFMLDHLPEFISWGIPICIQIVVTKDDIPALEAKIKRCFECGARAVVMPAAHLDKTKDYFPNPGAFTAETLRLRKKYPNTIITPAGYLKRFETIHCDTSSIIIDSNGELFYPCRTMAETAVNLTEVNLLDYVRSEEAVQARKRMVECTRRCMWYQYFASQFYTHPLHAISLLRPFISERLGFGLAHRRRKIIAGKSSIPSE